MPTFTVSPAVAAGIGARLTNPTLSAAGTTSPYTNALSQTFLNDGGIEFLNSGLTALAKFGFYDASTTSLFSGSTTFNNTTASLTGPANSPYLQVGMVMTNNQNGGNWTVSSYNLGTGAVQLTNPSGAYAGNVSAVWGVVGSSCMAVRSADISTGYVTFNSFPVVTPVVSGTIEYVLLRDRANTWGITFTAGDIGSGADIEINDRTLTTAQPWQLSGSIRVRLPMSYTYTL